MNIIQKRTGSLKGASYNPKKRSIVIAPLVKSIKKFGILSPILIDEKGNVIDGHRRLASAKQLKLEKVPTIMLKNIMANEAFETINTTAKKISNTDVLYIYINGGTVSKLAERYIEMLKEVLGDKGLKQLARKEVSYRIIDIATRVQKYISKDSNEWLVKIINWLADNKMSFLVRRAMESEATKESIINAIANNRPLQIDYK